MYRKCLVYICYQNKIESKDAYEAKLRWIFTRFHSFKHLVSIFLPSSAHAALAGTVLSDHKSVVSGPFQQRQLWYKMGGHPNLKSWDVQLNIGTGRNKVVKERLQQVPQQTAAPTALVQRLVFCYLSLLIWCPETPKMVVSGPIMGS